jgi:hypothetical protein
VLVGVVRVGGESLHFSDSSGRTYFDAAVWERSVERSVELSL